MINGQTITRNAAQGIALTEPARLIGITPCGLSELNSNAHGKTNKWSKRKPIVPATDVPFNPPETDLRQSATADGEYYGVRVMMPTGADFTRIDSLGHAYRAPQPGKHWARLSDWDGYHHTAGPYPIVKALGWTPGSQTDKIKGAAGQGWTVAAETGRGWAFTLPFGSDYTAAGYGINLLQCLYGDDWQTRTNLWPVIIIKSGTETWARILHNQQGQQAPIDLSAGLVNHYLYTPGDMQTYSGGSYTVIRSWLQAVGATGYGSDTSTGSERNQAESILGLLKNPGEARRVYIVLVNVAPTDTDAWTQVTAPSPSGGTTSYMQPIDLRKWVPLHRITGGQLGPGGIPLPWEGTYQNHALAYVDSN